MIQGEFNNQGELFFEIELMSADGEIFPVMALLDTGFTGWLAIDNQDADSLGWRNYNYTRDMQTARGEHSLVYMRERWFLRERSLRLKC